MPADMNGMRITKTRSIFSMTCRVAVRIQAEAPRVWNLLTDAKGFPRWNSTVASIDGEIRDGARLRLRVPGSGRVFSPVISEVVPRAHMTWTGGVAGLFKGVRTFDLEPAGDGSTAFAMEERFSGLMLPLVRRFLPDFGAIFERYADDLKRESERIDESVMPRGDIYLVRPSTPRSPG
jgi:hypothetical protein